MGGDPHFSIILPTGQLLCFSVQGEHNFTFNLVSNSFVSINARFDQDSKRPEVTWIGSLGVVIETQNKKDPIKIRFESSTKSIYIDSKVALSAKEIKKLTVSEDKLVVSEAYGSNRGRKYSEVDIEVVGSELKFSVRFMRSHLDMVWHKVGTQFANSHGILG